MLDSLRAEVQPRPPVIRAPRKPGPTQSAWVLDAGINVVLFAGLGGACDGLELAGLPVHVADNHDAVACAVHAARHPHTTHHQQDVFDLDPIEATGGRPVNVLWASPDCRHHSRAKGGALVSNRVRSLPWVVCRWLGQARPLVCFTENVSELRGWGPLIAKRDKATGRVIKRDGSVAEPGERVPRHEQFLLPDKTRSGKTFRRWRRHIESLGYRYEDRDLVAADYGVPTTRKRFFAVMRRDGAPIYWPERTHAPRDRAAEAGLKPWLPAASIIDWSLPLKSIFGRDRPLADATMRRIARGVVRYTANSYIKRPGGAPPLGVVGAFLTKFQQNSIGQHPDAPLDTVMAGAPRFGVCAAWLPQHNTGLIGHSPEAPLSTLVTRGCTQAVAAAHLTSFYTSNTRGGEGDLDKPVKTITAGGNHVGLIAAFLEKYYGAGGQDQAVDEPLDTLTAKARFGLVGVELAGVWHVIADIGMRMLEPEEGAAAHGFRPGVFPALVTVERKTRPLTKQERMALVGNSVPPRMAEVLARANPVQVLARPILGAAD